MTPVICSAAVWNKSISDGFPDTSFVPEEMCSFRVLTCEILLLYSTIEGECEAHIIASLLFVEAPSVLEGVPQKSEEIPKAVLQTRACIFHITYGFIHPSHDTGTLFSRSLEQENEQLIPHVCQKRCVPSEFLVVKCFYY